MERTQVAVPKKTAELVKEIAEKNKAESGVYESSGTIIAKAVAEYHKKVCE